MDSLELQISLVLFFALGGYLLSARLNQSTVVGVILIGVVMGPSLLNLISYSDPIGMAAHLGAILLMFSVGLEFRIRDVYRMKYFFIALSGLLIPWIAGYFTGVVFGYGVRESMFIGVSMTATSIAITAKVLEESKRLNSRVAKAIIGAAVIDDVLGLIALSVVIQMSAGGLSAAALIGSGVRALLFMAAGILAGPKVKDIFLRIDERAIARKYPEFLFMTAVTFCFLYASIAALAGLSAIVGAFLAGAVLEGVRFTNSKSLKEGAEYLHVIFGAIFFVSLGILANLRGLSAGIIPFMVVLVIVALATKLLGCGLSSKLAGYSSAESFAIGIGMAPRGEVAMIVALIGLTSKAITQDLYVGVVMMSLITTVITPGILQRLNWREARNG
jgi:Kef-type K+ transport system membrane component KefB